MLAATYEWTQESKNLGESIFRLLKHLFHLINEAWLYLLLRENIWGKFNQHFIIVV